LFYLHVSQLCNGFQALVVILLASLDRAYWVENGTSALDAASEETFQQLDELLRECDHFAVKIHLTVWREVF